MRIRYISDLHLEFIKPDKLGKFIGRIPPGVDDICVLAGDIGNPTQFHYNALMKYISNNFKKAFVIAGNHEYYSKTKTIEETNLQLEKYFKKYDNITFLNNSYEIYNNYCFIGSTLWSKITKPECETNDVYKIIDFDYVKYNKLNEICINFLENTINNNTNCIVITHHMPSESLIDQKYKTDNMKNYNQWFYSDLDQLIESNKDKIKCWIYGHTHTPSNVKINDIPFLCNPIGYPNENNDVDFETNIKID
jgi:predicted phosphohydrolase